MKSRWLAWAFQPHLQTPPLPSPPCQSNRTRTLAFASVSSESSMLITFQDTAVRNSLTWYFTCLSPKFLDAGSSSIVGGGLGLSFVQYVARQLHPLVERQWRTLAAEQVCRAGEYLLLVDESVEHDWRRGRKCRTLEPTPRDARCLCTFHEIVIPWPCILYLRLCTFYQWHTISMPQLPTPSLMLSFHVRMYS